LQRLIAPQTPRSGWSPSRPQRKHLTAQGNTCHSTSSPRCATYRDLSWNKFQHLEVTHTHRRFLCPSGMSTVEREQCLRPAAKHNTRPQDSHRSRLNAHTTTGFQRLELSPLQDLQCHRCLVLIDEFQRTRAVWVAANEKARLRHMPSGLRVP
jgi:hypothetical protein